MDTQTVDTTSQRADAILDDIKAVFAAKGFDGASMQDLAQAAQMSAGNFYRYFPSKNAIITALVERDMKQIESDFQDVHDAENPVAKFVEKLTARIETLDRTEAALWTEMQAASFRVPEITAVKKSMEDTLRRNVSAMLRRVHGDEPAYECFYTARTNLLIVLMHGLAQHRYCLQSLNGPDNSEALQDLIVKTIVDVMATPPSPTPQT